MNLYKTDSKGKIRIWYANTDNDKLIVSHGLQGGKIVTEETICTGKNIGWSNETLPWQQAEIECDALYKKKMDRDGYTESPNSSPEYIQPMLARDYTKVGHQVDWSVKAYASHKLDGVRAVWVQGQGFQSRKGTFYKVPHLEDALADTAELLDGELYVHGQPLNRIVAAVKKPNDLTPQIEFRVFDVVTTGDFDYRFHLAYSRISVLANDLIKVVPQLVMKKDQLLRLHHQFVGEGYEGVMIRQNGPYVQGQRSPHLFKYKEFQEDEFTILDVKPDTQGQGVLQCEGFDVRMRGTDAEREYMLHHPIEFIGKKVTVRYFALTEYGKPQFPVGVTIRDDI